jgi:hypothetical protein
MRELGLGTRLHAGHYVRIGAGYETTHRSLCENWGWVRDYTQGTQAIMCHYAGIGAGYETRIGAGYETK